MTELDERKAAVLRAIVEQYVDTAQPVGSQTVTSMTGLGVSAATVRNEMSLLEREGYIAQPHPSAGRVPTDRGYRYYVDHLAGAGQLPAIERRRIVEFFSSATFAMDQLLAQTSQLLANPANWQRQYSVLLFAALLLWPVASAHSGVYHSHRAERIGLSLWQFGKNHNPRRKTLHPRARFGCS